MAWVFSAVGVVLIVAGVVALTFSRQLNDALVRKRPPPPANRAEALRLFQIRAAGLVLGGVLSLIVGLTRA